MKKTGTLIVFIFIYFIISAKELPKKKKADNTNSANISRIVDDYINTISKNSSDKIVSLKECENSEARIEDYHNQIYTYHLSKLSYCKGYLNDDKAEDYVVSYTGSNCWRGNGAQNYLSNFFIITSRNNKLSVNEPLTKKIKQALLDALNKEYGRTSQRKAEKTSFINGIDFHWVSNGRIYGNYNINTNYCKSLHPCFKGNFIFNMKDNKTELH